jgi:hypothetical protein
MPEEAIFFGIYFASLLLGGLIIALAPVLKSQPKTPQEERKYEIVKDVLP